MTPPQQPPNSPSNDLSSTDKLVPLTVRSIAFKNRIWKFILSHVLRFVNLTDPQTGRIRAKITLVFYSCKYATFFLPLLRWQLSLLYVVIPLRLFLNIVESDQEIQKSVKTVTLAGREHKVCFTSLRKQLKSC